MARFLYHDPVLGANVYAIKKSEIPPRPPLMRKGYWDSVIRDVIPVPDDKVFRIKFSKEYCAETMESSARKAAARAGVKILVKSQGSTMYLWLSENPILSDRKNCANVDDAKG